MENKAVITKGLNNYLKEGFEIVTSENEEQFGFEKGTTQSLIDSYFGKTEDIEHEIVEPKQLPPVDNDE